MVDVSICMVTFNKLPFLKRAIAAILNSTDDSKSFELLIYNNGSSDYTTQYLSMLSHVCPEYIDCKIFNGKENIGLNAYGMIVPSATGEIIVTMDDDVFEIVPLGWENIFRKALTAKFGGRRFGYVSTDTINKDGGRLPDQALGMASLGGLNIEVGPAGGWFAATTKEVIELVGGFHTEKGKMHLEDLDFQSRVWEKGLLVGTVLNIEVLHARSPKYYRYFGREDTYLEKSRLAALEGITLEPLA